MKTCIYYNLVVGDCIQTFDTIEAAFFEAMKLHDKGIYSYKIFKIEQEEILSGENRPKE